MNDKLKKQQIIEMIISLRTEYNENYLMKLSVSVLEKILSNTLKINDDELLEDLLIKEQPMEK